MTILQKRLLEAQQIIKDKNLSQKLSVEKTQTYLTLFDKSTRQNIMVDLAPIVIQWLNKL